MGFLHVPRNVSSIYTTLHPLNFVWGKLVTVSAKHNLHVPSVPHDFLLVAPGGWKGYYSFPHVNSINILFEKLCWKNPSKLSEMMESALWCSCVIYVTILKTDFLFCVKIGDFEIIYLPYFFSYFLSYTQIFKICMNCYSKNNSIWIKLRIYCDGFLKRFILTSVFIKLQ